MVGRVALHVLAGVLAWLLATEMLLRLLPVSSATLTGYYADPMILGYPPGHRWTVSTGWDLRDPHRMRANNLGFAAPGDFAPDPTALALIGDSYVEASMLGEGDRPGQQLARALGAIGRKRPVYAMGGPGSSLLDYAERIRFARQRLGVRDFVVFVEAGDIRQATCGSGNVHAACLDGATLAPRVERQAPASTARRILRYSSLAQYVASQLKVTDPWQLVVQSLAHARPPAGGAASGAGTSQHGATGQPARLTADRRQLVEAVAGAFFDRVLPEQKGRLLLLVDGRRPGAAKSTAPLMLERDLFVQLARSRGVEVLDAQDVYAAQPADASGRSLEVGPHDHHLNRLGVQLLMQAVAMRGVW